MGERAWSLATMYSIESVDRIRGRGQLHKGRGHSRRWGMRTMAALLADIIVEGYVYVRKNSDGFTWEGGSRYLQLTAPARSRPGITNAPARYRRWIAICLWAGSSLNDMLLPAYFFNNVFHCMGRNCIIKDRSRNKSNHRLSF